MFSINQNTVIKKQKGLTSYKYAIYSAAADNESARELMEKDKLRELAVVLTDTIRKNASIDWTIKENVKANLRVSVNACFANMVIRQICKCSQLKPY